MADSPTQLAKLPLLQRIILAIRPKTLFLGLCPVILGTALGFADLDSFAAHHVGYALMTIAIVVLLQAGANLVNDVKDHQQGVDGKDRTGPQRAVAEGWLSAKLVTTLYRSCFALALLLSTALAALVDIRLIGVGIACAVAAYAYTGGPLPLAYYGLGELLAWLFFGPVAVISCYYLYHQSFDSRIFAYSGLTGVIAAAVMAINNYRDRNTDSASGKTTYATLLPQRLSLRIVQALILLPIGIFFLLEANQPKLGLAAFFAALMVLVVRRVLPNAATDGPMLNRTLGETSRYGLLVTVLASIKVLV